MSTHSELLYPVSITFQGKKTLFVPPHSFMTVFLDRCDFCNNPSNSDTSLLEIKRNFGYFVCNNCSDLCQQMRQVYHRSQRQIRWTDLYTS